MFLLWNKIFAQNLVSLDDYTKLITANIDLTWKWYTQQDKQVYYIMKELCAVLLTDKWVFIANNQTNSRYNPKESLFVTLTCNSLQWDTQDKEAKNIARPMNTILKLKRSNRRNMWLICSTKQAWLWDEIWDTACEKRSIDSNFDYPFLFYKTISQIQNDWSNLSIARTYGNIDNTITAQDLANQYIIDHYQTIGILPEAKNYPKTYKELTQYIKSAKKIQQEAYIIDINKTTPDQINATTLPNTSLFFLSNQPSTVDIATQQPSYHKINSDILYNELFFYTLFNSVYLNYLTRVREKNSGNIPISRKNKKIDESQAVLLQKSRVNQQKAEIIKATTETMRQLGNLEASYPIHIWFLMYQEDLLNVRNNFAKIYLPLHQLHYKLENVQSKD